jgi:hypothetical protein
MQTVPGFPGPRPHLTDVFWAAASEKIANSVKVRKRDAQTRNEHIERVSLNDLKPVVPEDVHCRGYIRRYSIINSINIKRTAISRQPVTKGCKRRRRVIDTCPSYGLKIKIDLIDKKIEIILQLARIDRAKIGDREDRRLGHHTKIIGM